MENRMKFFSRLLTTNVIGGIASLLIFINYCQAGLDVELFVKNVESGKNQTALCGHIESYSMIRGNMEFHLGPGEITIFDFGYDKPSAMAFIGHARVVYTPPDNIEKAQLEKYLQRTAIDSDVESIVFYGLLNLEDLPDTASFTREKPKKDFWKLLEQTRKTAIENLSINVTNRILADVLSDRDSKFFLANFENVELGNLIFCEDALGEDYYRLYRAVKKDKKQMVDIINGYTPPDKAAVKPGSAVIDISNYAITGRVDKFGKIKADCTVKFTAANNNVSFLRFAISPQIDILLAEDFNDNKLVISRDENEPGFGVLLNNSLLSGAMDSIIIKYEGTPFIKDNYIYYSDEGSPFYPKNVIPDKATYDFSIEHPYYFKCSYFINQDSSTTDKEKERTIWSIDKPVYDIEMGIGEMYVGTTELKTGHDVQMFIPVTSNWGYRIDYGSTEGEQIYAQAILGLFSSSVWFGNESIYMSYIISYCEHLMNSYPFNDIAIIETPFSACRGAAMEIFLSTYFNKDKRLSNPLVRSRQAAYQWWGHSVSAASYCDEWIIEGLAQYCGLLSVQSREPLNFPLDSMLAVWRDTIVAVQAESGPVCLGKRLSSSGWDYYDPIAIKKSAYIFNMIRNIMHDYRTGSDKRFIAFVQDLYAKYKDRTITTDDFENELAAHARMDMTWFFDQWVYGTDIPVYIFSFTTEKPSAEEFIVNCHIEQRGVPDNFRMMVPISLVYGDTAQIDMPILINQPVTDIPLPTQEKDFNKVIFNTYNAVLCEVEYK
jgi:hypothetical protein